LDKAERDGRIKMIIEYGGIFPPLQDFCVRELWKLIIAVLIT